MNSNTYSITAYSISYNTNSYYSVIIITVYQRTLKVKEMKIWKPYMLNNSICSETIYAPSNVVGRNSKGNWLS